MGFLFILLGIVIGMRILEAILPNFSKEEDKEQLLVVEAKSCPPHKWKFVDTKDENGNINGTRIVCELCGPLRSDDAPRGNGDYS